MTDLTVTIEKTIEAPIEKVFDAWLNPKILAKFMMPMPGMPESDVKNDTQEGGSFSIVMHAGSDDLLHTGKYLEIKRPNKLVFTWASHCSIDNSTVTLNFKKIDENKTKILLSHVKFIDEKTRSDHEGGWTNILNKLNTIIE
ncbi:SRPBCC family protein [Candidatus Thioglobus sp.]|uniref:SRPBCC family protein n=1 Tax=Candidatus Thioglobus sp. TaxID=2026721 RepID=UPI003D1209F3